MHRINDRNIELQLSVTPVEESIEAYDSVLGTLPDSSAMYIEYSACGCAFHSQTKLSLLSVRPRRSCRAMVINRKNRNSTKKTFY